MTLFKTLLAIHILCGGTSLLLGFVVMVSPKGNQKHKRLGNIYFFAMLISALVALPMSYLHSSYFLFVIGVFTSYMLLTGRRYLTKKNHVEPAKEDWFYTAAMSLFGIAFVALGLYNLINSDTFGIVLLVFGTISFLFVYQDYLNFNHKSKIENYWLTTHIQRMTGSYIASATAFLVVNNHVLPQVIAWLLPTALLVPLIVKWTRKYQTLTVLPAPKSR